MIERSRLLPWSVRPEVLGSSVRAEVPAGYSIGEWEIELGSGEATFSAACDALRRFDQFPREIVEASPKDAPITPGTVVALSAHAGGFHADFVCRLVEVIEETSPTQRRFGWSYATLEGHVERGEELFLIEHDRESDRVTYVIRAVSAPAHPLAWLAQPWIRSMQVRFGKRSADVIREAIGATDPLPPPRELHRRPPIGLPWFGLVIWLLALLAELTTGTFTDPERAPQLLLVSFAALVILPAARAHLPPGWFTSRLSLWIWAGSATALAFSTPLTSIAGMSGLRGIGEGAWFLATLAAAFRAGGALLAGRVPREFAGALLAVLLLPIGSSWAFMAQIGVWPGDFPREIAELTALHFHYAGAILPVILGLAVQSWRPALVPTAAIALLLATSLVAVGITFSPLLEVLGALALILLVVSVGVLQARAALLSESKLGIALLAIGALSLFVGIGLAATYSLGEFMGTTRGDPPYSGGGVISVDTMIPTHGLVMAWGFGLSSILGWLAHRETTPTSKRPDLEGVTRAAATG